MFVNCEKMVVIPPTNNQWPQIADTNHNISSSMGSGGTTTTTTMEKPSSQDLQQQQQQQSLKCPRCDSTNTKFCYYNNYSLSQPRHFCKSCKRYWTRGGTLRNVPVGGGCRKNKRVRRQTSSSASDHHNNNTPSNSSSSSPPPPRANNTSNLPSSHVSPLFYGLPSAGGNSNHSDMNNNLPFPRFNSGGGYDHLGLLGGFSSGYASSDSLFSNYNSILGNSMIFGNSSTAISSLLGPGTNLQQQKFIINGGLKDDVVGSISNTFHGLDPLEEVKVEGVEKPNQIVEHGSLFDYYSSPYYWNDQTNNVGPSPSVTSMIE